jgi:putative endonuclease
MSYPCYIYILTSPTRNVLYVGVTHNLTARLVSHRASLDPNSFVTRYNATILIYYEKYSSMYDAIAREKQLKAGSRKRKVALINAINPTWRDLSDDPSITERAE